MDAAYDEGKSFLEAYGSRIFDEHCKAIMEILRILEPYRNDLVYIGHYSHCAYYKKTEITNDYNVCICYLVDRNLIYLKYLIDKYKNLININDKK